MEVYNSLNDRVAGYKNMAIGLIRGVEGRALPGAPLPKKQSTNPLTKLQKKVLRRRNERAQLIQSNQQMPSQSKLDAAVKLYQ